MLWILLTRNEVGEADAHIWDCNSEVAEPSANVVLSHAIIYMQIGLDSNQLNNVCNGHNPSTTSIGGNNEKMSGKLRSCQ